MEVISISREEGFVPGVTYEFEPPVKTNCIAVSGQGGWQRKYFDEGWCLEFKKGVGVFQGKSLEGRDVYFFKVTYGGGSIATEKCVSVPCPKKETGQ